MALILRFGFLWVALFSTLLSAFDIDCGKAERGAGKIHTPIFLKDPGDTSKDLNLTERSLIGHMCAAYMINDYSRYDPGHVEDECSYCCERAIRSSLGRLKYKMNEQGGVTTDPDVDNRPDTITTLKVQCVDSCKGCTHSTNPGDKRATSCINRACFPAPGVDKCFDLRISNQCVQEIGLGSPGRTQDAYVKQSVFKDMTEDKTGAPPDRLSSTEGNSGIGTGTSGGGPVSTGSVCCCSSASGALIAGKCKTSANECDSTLLERSVSTECTPGNSCTCPTIR